MASKAARQVLISLGVTKGVTEMIENVYKYRSRNSTVMELIAAINKKADHAFSLWPDQLNEKELKQIKSIFDNIENNIVGTHANIVVLTSLISGLISDRRDYLKEKKRDCFNSLLISIRRLHRHFDRHLESFEKYDLAAAAIKEIKL